jgi:DNA-directed RNA polymerase specialized sigma24 family protein
MMDPEHIEAVWCLGYARACAAAAAILPDSDLVHDVATDTAMKAITYMQAGKIQFKFAGQFVRWVQKVARREALSEIRREQRSQTLVPGTLLPPAQPTLRDWWPKVRQCIDRLPSEQREILRLYYEEGMTDGQIGKRFGENNQKFRRTRRLPALQALADLLIAEGVEPGYVVPPPGPNEEHGDES